MAIIQKKKGNFLEDFRVGHTFRHKVGKTVNEGLFNAFTEFTMTTNPLSKNRHYAERYGYRDLICPPGLTMAVIFSQSVEDVSENARANLLEKKPRLVQDQVGRSYGILTNAHTISSKEALNLLSLLRLGVDLGLFPATERVVVDELFIISQPAHVQKAAGRDLDQLQRRIARADLVRRALSTLM